MYINIITPCSRPENLQKISKSINIPKENYRWIVVFDSLTLPHESYIPNNCEIYLYKDSNSISGNGQRNLALDLVKTGHIYFNDDDTLIHPNLWENIKEIESDFISFIQINKDGSIRLKGDEINIGYVDSHNFVVSQKIINNTRFIIDKYDADGYFAKECYNKSTIKTYIDKELSIYNLLR
jgi:hypothetical protein